MHRLHLLKALEIAKQRRGFCAPNPSVGAIAVKNNEIIAQAGHLGSGQLHAEQKLIQALPPGVMDVTLYVTLEPCNHWGKTPPCTDAIINSAITKVVYAYQDPNPVVIKNNTTTLLTEAGIEVIHHPVAEIKEFYSAYAYWQKTGLPHVCVKIAQSLDGKIAKSNGEPVQISNESCAKLTHQRRYHADVILSSCATINNDNPKLNARVASGDFAKPVAIIDSHLQLNENAQVWESASRVLIFHKSGLKARDGRAEYYAVNETEHGLCLKQIFAKLGELGFHDVWVEVGATLFNQIHESKLANETLIYIAPLLLGNSATALCLKEQSYLSLAQNNLQWDVVADNIMAKINWEKQCSPV